VEIDMVVKVQSGEGKFGGVFNTYLAFSTADVTEASTYLYSHKALSGYCSILEIDRRIRLFFSAVSLSHRFTNVSCFAS
jgi:hypothetical protein